MTHRQSAGQPSVGAARERAWSPARKRVWPWWADLVASVEWRTLSLIVGCYAAWAGVLYLHVQIGLWPALAAGVVLTVLHSSLQHETIHGHPTRSSLVNGLLVLPALGLFVPYGRFRDVHIHHHRTGRLTDPADDPESGYLTAEQWRWLGPVGRALAQANTTLLGRMTLGPAIALGRFYVHEAMRLRLGEWAVLRSWLMHGVAVAPVLAWVWLVCGIDPLLYLAAVAYPAYGVLMLRTFAEHQAHPDEGMRTAIVEDRGPLAFLFLYNNLHVVHHLRPDLPWYALPQAYWRSRSLWTSANGGYVFPSYRALIARHLLRAKEPVVHPSATLADA